MKFAKLGGVGAALLATATAQNGTVVCQNGLHVIVARASGEAVGFGVLGLVKDQIIQKGSLPVHVRDSCPC